MSDLRLTWLDRLLIRVAPQWGLRRVRARAAAALLIAGSRHYDAAGGGRRTTGWHRSSSDANTAAQGAITTLRELSRDLRRNNGWARRGIQVIAGNTTGGWGIVPKAVRVDPDLAKQANELWGDWADSTECDFDGRLPFAGLQRLVMETIVESGEVLVLRQPVERSDGLPIPLRVQVLEPDYLDVSRTGMSTESGNRIVQGIEFDRLGRRVAYWLYHDHPGAALPSARLEVRRVPASDVLHIYRVDRPGQIRGVPWLASAIARLHDYDDFEDAELMAKKIAACFAAFVEDIESGGAAIGEQSETDATLETLEPGHIAYLSPGKTIKFATPPTVTDSSFTVRNLRRIAVSLGVTYEDLTGDYSNVNFSSARMARLAHWINVHEWRWSMLIPQFCDGVWRWAMEYAAALNQWPVVPRAEWSAPPMPMIDPDKEGLAITRMVRSGAKSLFQAIREQGEDPIALLDEIAEANKALDERGIVLDSDPRRTSASGGAQGGGGPSGSEQAGEEGDEGADSDGTDVARRVPLFS